VLTQVAIRAVAYCRVSDAARSRVQPASKAEALLAIAPTSLLQIHGRRRDSLDRLARLVDRVPCFRLELGSDLASIPAAIDEILHRAAGLEPHA
jgi:hypothetical protein